MSVYYYIACHDCRECLHVTDHRYRLNPGVYEPSLIGRFLWKHEDHRLGFHVEDSNGIEEYTEQPAKVTT